VKTTIVASLIDSCPGCRRPHAVHPVAKISKVKDLALIFIDKCILYFISCQKTPLTIVLLHLFTLSQPFNLSSVVNPVAVL